MNNTKHATVNSIKICQLQENLNVFMRVKMQTDIETEETCKPNSQKLFENVKNC